MGQKLKKIQIYNRSGPYKLKNGPKMAILGHFRPILLRSRQKSSKFDKNGRFLGYCVGNYIPQVGKIVLRAIMTIFRFLVKNKSKYPKICKF